jgi:hypothetical protein
VDQSHTAFLPNKQDVHSLEPLDMSKGQGKDWKSLLEEDVWVAIFSITDLES